jgi:NAD-dependent dihydropyrimidine dehydrogenase PreA subunit
MKQDWVIPTVNPNICTGCGNCVAACPNHVIGLSAQRPVFTSPENCTYCTQCETTCPEQAIRCEFIITWESDKQ